MALDALTLQKAMPGLTADHARDYVGPLSAAMVEGEITTEARAAYFLALLGHESASLRYFEEIGSGAAYEGRHDLGNVHPGDGPRFKGRGPISLTGRSNYRAAGEALGLDLEDNPTLAARPDIGFRVAVWFWNVRDFSAAADRGDFRHIARPPGGGYSGWDDRVSRLKGIERLGSAILPEPPRPLAGADAESVE